MLASGTCTVHEALERRVVDSVTLAQYAVEDDVEFSTMLDTRYVTLSRDIAGVGAGRDVINVALIGPDDAEEPLVMGCAATSLLLLVTATLS